MRNLKKEIGTKIRRLREERKLSREAFCRDESELTVRQLVRIEKGESLPSLPKLDYIASVLGIPMARIVDEEKVALPPRYLELKHRLIHFMTYGDKERMQTEEAIYDEIYNCYYDDLPEDEQLAVEALYSIFNVFATERAEYGEQLIEEYFDQLMVKEVYNINDLLLVELYIFLCIARRKGKEVMENLAKKVVARIHYDDMTEVYLVKRILIAVMAVYYQDEEYSKLQPHLDTVENLSQLTQDFQQKPTINMLKALYELYVQHNLEKAEILFDQAILCAEVLGEKVLAEKIGEDKNRLLEKWKKQQKDTLMD